MGAGVHADVQFEAPSGCVPAATSRRGETTCQSVSKFSQPDDDEVVEEFTLDGPITERSNNPSSSVVSTVFDAPSKHVYRFSRPVTQDCPCELLHRAGCPVEDVQARDGTLYVSLYAEDLAQLRDAFRELSEAGSAFSVRRLVRSEGGDGMSDLVFFDREELTTRQREILETAHDMGYFEYPKDANAGEIADALEISRSTFTAHLSAAQRKILTALIDD